MENNTRQQVFITYDGVNLWKDKIIMFLVGWAIPSGVTPNHITLFRLVMIPIVSYFLLDADYVIGAVLFLIAALSDALDGALARTRDQITEWGKLFDPIADKVLIGTAAVIVVARVLGKYLALAIVLIEVLLIVSAYLRNKRMKKTIEANWAGKLKMTLQSLGVLFVLLAAHTGVPIYAQIGAGVLYLGIFFAILSLLVYKSI